jgi:tRNA-Thr(GGU) m(6)t(6)A37 methyltransferase TsaA
VAVHEYGFTPIGHVESALVHASDAPRQGDEGGPDAWLAFDDAIAPALAGIEIGADLLLFTWLHRARRDVLAVRPRGDPERPVQGVFGTRSPDRPNPIGLHRVTVLAIDGTRVRVSNLEALDGTPIVDVKPVLDPVAER